MSHTQYEISCVGFFPAWFSLAATCHRQIAIEQNTHTHNGNRRQYAISQEYVVHMASMCVAKCLLRIFRLCVENAFFSLSYICFSPFSLDSDMIKSECDRSTARACFNCGPLIYGQENAFRGRGMERGGGMGLHETETTQ